jgi:serine/threonine protein kinase/tetratricopeptide (TPR) repeat protein
MEFAHFQFDPETDRLGEGPLSEVYRAVDQQLGRTVALKILRAHAEIDPAADQRFHREAKHASNLQHPKIATIYEYGQARNTAFIAMEFLDGRTLDKILKERKLGYDECLRIALQVTEAIEHVHKSGLIHRDLKPGNIMVLDDGTVKLLDFGIARASNESSITQHGTLVGTVLYMSPEQVRGDDLDKRSDIFSLGAVLFHLWTGSLPFPGKSFPEVCMAILDGKPARPSAVRSGCPKAFEDMIMRCLSASPDARYQSAGDALAALEPLLVRRPGGGTTSAKIQGKLLLMPIECSADASSACEDVAGSLRKDLAKNIARTKGLEVELAPTLDLPQTGSFDFVLRSSLGLRMPDATLDLMLEPYARNGAETALEDRTTDTIHQSDEDEWTLQDGLVRAASRTIRRRLKEMAVTPTNDTERHVEKALLLARKAHDVLYKGTSKHLMAAISTFRAATDADPYCSLAYAGLAEALVRKYLYFEGDEQYLSEARMRAERALALDAECAEAHTSLGYAYHQLGHLTEAEREYRVAIRHDGDEWLAHRLLGSIFAWQGNFKTAAGYLRRAIALKPQHIPSYDRLYNVLRRLDRLDESYEIADDGIATARKHISKHPDHQEARLHLALLLARLASHDEARKHVQRALEIAPKDGYTSLHAACVFSVTGDYTDAITQLTRARDRGFYIQVELRNNPDLEVLRDLPDFAELSS